MEYLVSRVACQPTLFILFYLIATSQPLMPPRDDKNALSLREAAKQRRSNLRKWILFGFFITQICINNLIEKTLFY